MKPDIAELVRHADLDYQGTVPRSEEGLPIGNGRMGTLLWTSPSALKMQVNRVDVYGNGPASSSFNTVHSGYGYACAFVDFDFVDYGEDVFDGDTRQHLDVYDATVKVRAKGIQVEGFASSQHDVFAFRIGDDRPRPHGIGLKLKMLRYPEVERLNHVAVSSFHRVGDVMVLRQVFVEGDFTCASAVAVKTVGRKGIARINSENSGIAPILPNRGFQGGVNGIRSDAKRGDNAALPDFQMVGFGAESETEMRWCLPPENGSFLVYVASSASLDRDVDVVALAVAEAEKAAGAGYDALHREHTGWWHEFWARSYVRLWGFAEAEEIEKHYTYYFYIMASCSRGSDFAPNFGGLLFSPRGDLRHWGNMQWWSNLNLTYNAVLPSGRRELIEPFFMMYFNAYDAWAEAARQQFGAGGIFIGETSHVLGPERLPEHLAAELRDFLLGRGPEVFSGCSTQLKALALSRHPFETRWNFRCNYDKAPDFPRFAYVTHFFCNMGFFAYQYYLHYEYTHDLEFLERVAYPMIRGVAEFFRTYPNTRKGADGKYHIHGTTDDEDFWGAYDSAGSLTAMKGLYPVAVKVARLLSKDEALIPVWEEFWENLTDIPTNRNSDAARSTPRGIDKEVWIPALGDGYARMDGKTALWPCVYMDLCNIQTEKVAPEIYRIGRDTVDYTLSLHDPDDAMYTMEMSPWPRIQAGMGNSTRLVPNISGQLRCVNAAREHCYYGENGAKAPYMNRLTAREGINAISAQRLGNAAAGLQMGLLQCSGGAPGLQGVIRLFPAWDMRHNAEFELYARDGFKVWGKAEDGVVAPVVITSTLGGPCLVVNPWRCAVAVSSEDGKQILEGETIRFETRKGVLYTLAKAVVS